MMKVVEDIKMGVPTCLDLKVQIISSCCILKTVLLPKNIHNLSNFGQIVYSWVPTIAIGEYNQTVVVSKLVATSN